MANPRLSAKEIILSGVYGYTGFSSVFHNNSSTSSSV